MTRIERRFGIYRRIISRCFSFAPVILAMLLAGAALLATPGPGPRPLHAGMAGALATQGAPSPSAQSLTIAPKSIILMAGQPQVFRLFDDQQRPVRDATWSLNDPSLADLKVSGDTASVTGLSRGKIVLTATWKSLSAQARITVIGESALSQGGAEKSEEWYRVTPDIATVIVGEARLFRLVDVNGHQVGDAQWSVSNSQLAGITPGRDALLMTRAAGKVTVTAEGPGHRAEAEVTILAGPTLPEGTVKWSVKELPGFATTKITPAVPSPSGVDVFANEQDGCGRSVVRALTAEGLEVWRRQLTPGVNPAAKGQKSPFKLADSTCPTSPQASGSTRH